MGVKFELCTRKSDNASRLAVFSPYHPTFPANAKRLGGRWDAGRKVWHFDPRDEQRVRELCRETFGDDGTADKTDLVSVRIKLSEHPDRRDSDIGFTACGREVCRVWGRDSGAKFGDGVVVVAGSVSSGGSRKNPCLSWSADAVIELRDVPRAVAERESVKPGVEIVEQESVEAATDRIRAELVRAATAKAVKSFESASDAQLKKFVENERAITFDD